MSTSSPPIPPVEPHAASGGGSWPRRHSRALALAVVAVIAAAGALAATDPFSSPSRGGSGIDNAYPTSTATIEQKTITEQTDVSATLGYSGSYTVTIPSGTGASAVASDEAAVASDERKLTDDETSLAQAKALARTSGAATLLAARAAVRSDTSTLAAARTQLSEDENLSCPSASSSTVTTAASGSGSGGASDSTAAGATGGTGGGAHILKPAGTLAPEIGGTAATTAPSATTGSANALSPTSETLTGTVDPGGLATTYEFRYGTTSAMSQVTATYSLGADAGISQISIDVVALAPSTTYEYQLVATNSLGSASGEVENFASSESSCAAQKTVIAEDTQALAGERDALAADKTTANSSIAGDEQTVTGDKATLATDEATLAGDRSSDQGATASYTALPAVGANLVRGSSVYSLNDEPVPLFYGTATIFRALFAGEHGPDVSVLQENLVALGYGSGLVANGVFGTSTTAAVRAWQGAIGVPVTGQVNLGAIVVAPGPLRVTSVTAANGAQAQPGSTVLAATSTARVVTISLDANLEGNVKVGDSVSVTLPSGATTPGVVSSVGTVASAGSGGTGSTPTVSVLVSLADPSAAGDLDEASVEVAVTTGSAPNALVVPVDALLALASGGYALEEVASNGTHHLVGVTTGIFDDAAGLVSVTGSDIAPGQKIVVPAL